MSTELLRVSSMNKSFGPTIALNNVTFELEYGEIHGLVGENGSGKSTLAAIIAGLQSCDSGAMLMEGADYSPRSVVEAQKLGVAMVVQEMGTIPAISVAENIFLCKENRFRRFGLISQKLMNKAAREALAKINDNVINPATRMLTLDYEDRKIVEIATAINEEPDILIVDETTTSLSQRGREILYHIMNDMRKHVKSVIFISHDLDEIMDVCNRITVLRDGSIIGTLNKDEFDSNKLRTMMVGRELKGEYYRSDYGGGLNDEVALAAEHITGEFRINDVSVRLHTGEILGIGGLTSSGMHELGRMLFGLDKYVTGKVHLKNGKTIKSTHHSVRNQVGYVAKNRDQEALMLGAGIEDNIALQSLDRLMKGALVSHRQKRKLAKRMIRLLEIKCREPSQMTNELSGGNKQKVVFAKWIGNESKVLILDCPTRGVDVGVKQAMYQLMFKLKQETCSIVLISEELPELIGMSDRILIFKNGEIAGEYMRNEDLSEHDLIQAMI